MQTDNIRQIQWGRNASWGHIDSAYQEYGAMMSDVLFSTVIFPCGIELRRHEVLYLSLIMGKVSRKKEAIYRIPDAETGISSLMARDIASRTVTLALIIIIILISFGVYFTALFNGFVHDDLTQVLENQWIKSVSHIPEIFTKSVWSFKSEITSSNYYRPMMHVIYMLDYHLFGLAPWGFHLVNILLHAGVSVLVFLLTLNLFKTHKSADSSAYVLPSFIASILFATHPIHTEAVTWVAGTPELSFTLFYLLSLYLYILSGEGNRYCYTSSLILFSLAAFSKETALTLPILLAVYDYTFKKEKEPASLRLKRYIPYLVIVGIYLMCRFHALGGFAPKKRHMELSFYQYVINVFPLFSQYLEKLFLPVNLNAWYVFHPITSLFQAKGILSIAVTIAFIFFGFLAWRRNKIAFWGLVLTFLPLMPVLYIPGVGMNTFAERYLYLPSFGFIILLALLFEWLRANKSKATIALIAVAIAIIGLYSIGTISRNKVWKDNYTLLIDTARKSSDSYIVHDLLGNELSHRGMMDKAIEHYEIALRLAPDFAEGHNNMGTTLNNKGLFDDAAKHLQIALRLKPNFSEAYDNLGNSYLGKGLFDKAIENYLIALEFNPENADAHYNLGSAYYLAALFDQAIEQYKVAVRLKPADAEAHKNMGLAYLKKGLKDEAIREFKTALQINPNFTEARKDLESIDR